MCNNLSQSVEYHLKEAGEKYRKGLVGLAEVATLAQVSIYEMMEYIQREKIQSPPLTQKEMENELKEANEIFKSIKKNHHS